MAKPTGPCGPLSRGSLRLAFVAALQHLPPRQRAVLILRHAFLQLGMVAHNILRWVALAQHLTAGLAQQDEVGVADMRRE